MNRTDPQNGNKAEDAEEDLLPSISVTLLSGECVAVSDLALGASVADLCKALLTVRPLPPTTVYRVFDGADKLDDTVVLSQTLAISGISGLIVEPRPFNGFWEVVFAGGLTGLTWIIDNDKIVYYISDNPEVTQATITDRAESAFELSFRLTLAYDKQHPNFIHGMQNDALCPTVCDITLKPSSDGSLSGQQIADGGDPGYDRISCFSMVRKS